MATEELGTASKDDLLMKDFFFVENPNGLVDAVAGLENLPEPEHREAPTEVRQARLQCHVCNHLLEYDSRAHFVQCGNCNTLNAVRPNETRGGRVRLRDCKEVLAMHRVMIVICGHCNTRNIAALGSVYVECWLCHTVCQVEYPPQSNNRGARRGRPPNRAATQQPTTQQAMTISTRAVNAPSSQQNGRTLPQAEAATASNTNRGRSGIVRPLLRIFRFGRGGDQHNANNPSAINNPLSNGASVASA